MRFRTTGSNQVLRPVQAASLIEAYLAQGLFGPQCMGSGVNLSSFLLPLVLESKNTMMLLPAAFREKMRRDIESLRHHWVFPANVYILSYEELAHRGENPLWSYHPDLIVVPDCSKLKNTDTKTTKRVAEYMEQNPSTKFVAFTLDVYNFENCQHIIQWCLKDKTPVRLEGESRADYRSRLLQTRGVVGHLPEVTVTSPSVETTLVSTLVSAGLAETQGQARTFVEQNAVEIDGVKVTDKDKQLSPGVYTIKVGKRASARVTLGAPT